MDTTDKAKARAEKEKENAQSAQIAAEKKDADDFWNEWIDECMTEHKKYQCQVIWKEAGFH